MIIITQLPSSAPSGVVYPPTCELSITVLVSDSSGLVVSNTTFPMSQSNAFFNLRNNGSYTISLEANHDTTGSSSSITIPLTSMSWHNLTCIELLNVLSFILYY